MNKRILIFSDSLALPRQTPELCSYETTWPVLLQKAGNVVHQVSIGGATTSDLVKQVSYHKLFNPEIVIVQAGIVDCAPRKLTRESKILLEQVPLVGKKISGFIHKGHVFKRRTVYTPPEIFKKNISLIQEQFSSPVGFLSICPPTLFYDEVLPGIKKNITAYNLILKNTVSNFIDLKGIEQFGLMSDYHHLNTSGHKFVFTKISNWINGNEQ